MFGGSLEVPKYVKRSRPTPMRHDIQLPTLQPGVFGHVARPPNTDHHVQLLHWRQRMNAGNNEFLANESKRLLNEATSAKYDKHFEKTLFKREIQDRFKEKLKAYDQTIEERRKKLRDLLCEEEQKFIYETVEIAQKGADTKLQEMKERAEHLRAQREAERMEIVNAKRKQQYIESCVELRPALAKKNLIESKNGQLHQILENQSRRDAEKEFENMYHHLMMKEIEDKRNREEQDVLKRNQKTSEMLEVWSQQIRGKEMLKEETERVATEDRLEMAKLRDQIRREEIEALDAKRRKRDEIARELQQQIAIQEKFLEQKKKEERALEEAFAQLAAIEVKKERDRIQDTTKEAKRESAIYRQHLKELEEERRKEEKELNALLETHRRSVEKIQEDAFCKLKAAKMQLQKDVMQGRAEQLEWRRQEAENQLRLKEAENELLRMACETNERLQAEHDRLQAETERLYRQDLQKQIDSNNHKREREREELARTLAEGIEEEAKYKKLVDDMISEKIQVQTHKHPFRGVVENRACPCSPGNNQQLQKVLN